MSKYEPKKERVLKQWSMWSLSQEVCEIEEEPFKEKAGTVEMGSLQVEVEHLRGKGESSEKVREEEDQEVGNPTLILV